MRSRWGLRTEGAVDHAQGPPRPLVTGTAGGPWALRDARFGGSGQVLRVELPGPSQKQLVTEGWARYEVISLQLIKINGKKQKQRAGPRPSLSAWGWSAVGPETLHFWRCCPLSLGHC